MDVILSLFLILPLIDDITTNEAEGVAFGHTWHIMHLSFRIDALIVLSSRSSKADIATRVVRHNFNLIKK